MKTFWVDICALQPSQIYISDRKLSEVRTWFDTGKLTAYEPLSVYDYRADGRWTLTDGHTRALTAWLLGAQQIKVYIDQDEISTSAIAKKKYIRCVDWCTKRGIDRISSLENRVLLETKYEVLWRGRCDRMDNLVELMESRQFDFEKFGRIQNEMLLKGLSIYGCSPSEFLPKYFYADDDQERLYYIESSPGRYSPDGADRTLQGEYIESISALLVNEHISYA